MTILWLTLNQVKKNLVNTLGQNALIRLGSKAVCQRHLFLRLVVIAAVIANLAGSARAIWLPSVSQLEAQVEINKLKNSNEEIKFPA